MPIELFGFSIGRSKEEQVEPKSQRSFVAPDEYDGTTTIDAGGVFGTFVDFTGSIRDENQLISQYRGMSLYPEVDQAISDIVSDSVVHTGKDSPVSINLENLAVADSIKNKISSEFSEILRILEFGKKGTDIFRRWYVDSKLYFHVIIDEKNPSKGIMELRAIDPTKIKRIRKVERDTSKVGMNQLPTIKKIEEFYLYTNQDKDSKYYTPVSGIKIAPDSVCYVHSGMVDTGTKRVVGYLQKAIRPVNMLRQIEDAVVIYRISRAPERRIFYIDVGNLPKQKAEQYIKGLMNRYRSKLIYDSTSGEIRDDRKHMHMLEDYWLPRREGGRGTEISTLDGGQNLGEMEDVNYLLKKVYSALNIPASRMETENGFNMGRSAEITRDEVKFTKFVERLRSKFSELFVSLLRVQLVLKGVMSEDDWKLVSPHIGFDFESDSYFTELKHTEILRERLEILQSLDEYIGKYYSHDWVRRNILKQTDEEIKMIDSQIQQEQPAEGEGEEL